jgi:hypothetical protein
VCGRPLLQSSSATPLSVCVRVAQRNVVAINEAFALLRRTRGETPVGTLQAETHGHNNSEAREPADTNVLSIDERALEHIAHTQRIEAFLLLKPREPEALYLNGTRLLLHRDHAATGATYTAVNRRLSEGRAVPRGGRSSRTRSPRARRAHSDNR